jgi:FMN phosphatase YigB (HAD superfamily)
MKTILVDAIHALFDDQGNIFTEMYDLLETFENEKIILTGANDEQFKSFGLDKAPYEVFTLKHNPEKTDPEYFKTMLNHFNLAASDVIYFEHYAQSVISAESAGILTYFYDNTKKDLDSLNTFITNNI